LGAASRESPPSVFALAARPPDDGGEEAGALRRAHQHGRLVLVSDLNLEEDRKREREERERDKDKINEKKMLDVSVC